MQKIISMLSINMKRCSVAFAIGEMHIKAMRYHYVLIRMAEMKKVGR